MEVDRFRFGNGGAFGGHAMAADQTGNGKMTLSIRSARAEDIPLIAQFIRDLAEYERLAHEVRFDEAVLQAKLFGPRPYAEVLIGEIDGEPQGFALFFHNFSIMA